MLADRERGPAQLLLAAVGSQLLFHAAFVLVGHAGDAGLVPDPRLLAIHLCVAAVLALLAAHADTLLWSLVHLLVRAWIPHLAVVPAYTIGLSRPAYAAPAEPRIRLDTCADPRRGPPTC